MVISYTAMRDIEKDYTEEMHRDALSLFDADSFETTSYESTESLVFEYLRNSSPHILKIINPSQRPLDALLGEIELLDYLHRNGLGVCTAVASKNGNFVETIRSGDTEYLALSYIKAPGCEMD